MKNTFAGAKNHFTVICTIHFYPGCMEKNQISTAESGDTDWNRSAGTCLSETSDWRQWAGAASDSSVVSNQATDQ